MADQSSFQNIVVNLQNLVQSINAVTATVNGALAMIWGAFAEQELVDANTIAIDLSAGINFSLKATSTVGATRELGNPNNAKVGQRGYIKWVQDAAGGRALTYDSDYRAAGGTGSLTPTTTANAINVFTYIVMPGPLMFISLSAGVAA